ncbi:MAG: MoxR family ATPase [Actinomycetota bacterium]
MMADDTAPATGMASAADPRPVDHDEAIQVLQVARRIGYASVLWGDVGIGKSTLVERFGRELGVPVITVIASQSDPTDFGGMPVQSVASVVSADGVDHEVPTVDYALPDWAAQAFAAGEAIILLDEFTNASPSVQAAALEVILNRKVGRVRLPDAVQFIAAANPPEIAANGFELSPPTANRFMHLHLAVPSATAWTDALVDGWGLGPLPDHERTAAAAVAAFIRSRPNLLHDRPNTAGAAGLAWPSPRTWAQVVKGLAVVGVEASSQAQLVVESLVGPFASREFLHWLTHIDLPDPAHALANPSSVEFSPQRPDRAYAILLSIVLHAKEIVGDRPAVWTEAMSFLAHAADTVPDIAAHAARTLPSRPEGAELPANITNFLEVLAAAGFTQG